MDARAAAMNSANANPILSISMDYSSFFAYKSRVYAFLEINRKQMKSQF